MKGTIETEKETPVHSSMVQERIRSGGRNGAYTVREVNAVEPRNPIEMLRGTSLPAVKQEYRSPPSQARDMSHAKREAHSVTVPKPCPCSNRGSDWSGRRARNCSTSCSAGLASSRTCSPQIAGPTGRPQPKLRIVSCPSCQFDSMRIRRLSQRKAAYGICEAANTLQPVVL